MLCYHNQLWNEKSLDIPRKKLNWLRAEIVSSSFILITRGMEVNSGLTKNLQ